VVSVTVAAALACWPVTVGVVKVDGVSQPGADAERYTCACWLDGRGDGISAASTGGFLVQTINGQLNCSRVQANR